MVKTWVSGECGIESRMGLVRSFGGTHSIATLLGAHLAVKLQFLKTLRLIVYSIQYESRTHTGKRAHPDMLVSKCRYFTTRCYIYPP